MKNYSHFKFNIVLLLLFTLFSCKKEALFNAGETVSRNVLLDNNIKCIEVQAMLNITLVQDTITKAIITCGENLQSDVDINVRDSILYLKSDTKYNWSRSYKRIELELHLVSIPQINIRKPVYMTTRDTFKTKEFFLIDWEKFTELDVTLDVGNCAIVVSSENFGRYTIKGKALTATFNNWGSAFMYADGMHVQNCIVNQRSIGDIYVNVVKELRVSFESTGKVYYYGNPTVSVENLISNSKLVHITEE